MMAHGDENEPQILSLTVGAERIPTVETSSLQATEAQPTITVGESYQQELPRDQDDGDAGKGQTARVQNTSAGASKFEANRVLDISKFSAGKDEEPCTTLS